MDCNLKTYQRGVISIIFFPASIVTKKWIALGVFYVPIYHRRSVSMSYGR